MVVEDWERAAREVERRMSELRLTRTALAASAHVDRKTVDNFLDRGAKPRTTSRGGYEAALGWAYGSLSELARGQEAIPHRKAPLALSVVEAIDADPELSDEDKRALKMHYAGLLAFARQRRRYGAHGPPGAIEPDPTGDSPVHALSPDPSEGRDPPALYPVSDVPEPAND